MHITQFKKLAVIFGSALLLQGCVAALIGGGAAAAKVGTDPRTVKSQYSDEKLEFQVYNAIEKDEQIKEEGRVVVVSYNARILLIGQLPNESLKEVATGLAKGVEGVGDVYNEMRVGSPITVETKAKDSWITTKIKSNLLLNAEVKTTDVKVITENGEVFLMGDVTPSQADAAATEASKVSGVKKVIKVFKYLN
ncbi:division/outer membrane stress-associated lipid-binding lipoprotein [Pasteurellaceae bacterium LIM206]|nr:division/outer membrane stress-associated lipid-binding lipoprotein [Pasteurellaceae bacterium LIM206]